MTENEIILDAIIQRQDAYINLLHEEIDRKKKTIAHYVNVVIKLEREAGR